MEWVSQEIPSYFPAHCIVQASNHYDVPVPLMVAVLKVEGGKLGVTYPRSHGTYLGPYQISDKWLDRFTKWNYTAERVAGDPCVNAAVAGYILAFYKLREPTWSNAVARYNVGSLNTEKRLEAGQRYAKKVFAHWRRIHEKWINPND